MGARVGAGLAQSILSGFGGLGLQKLNWKF